MPTVVKIVKTKAEIASRAPLRGLGCFTGSPTVDGSANRNHDGGSGDGGRPPEEAGSVGSGPPPFLI
jgi:hypothetical protein